MKISLHSIHPVNCTSDEFTCENGECIDDSRRCDGSFDCFDSTDELESECPLVDEDGKYHS